LENTNKNSEWKISQKKTCEKTAATMERKHSEALFLGVEHKKVEKTGRERGYLEANS
jgi:hypothetical protein